MDHRTRSHKLQSLSAVALSLAAAAAIALTPAAAHAQTPPPAADPGYAPPPAGYAPPPAGYAPPPPTGYAPPPAGYAPPPAGYAPPPAGYAPPPAGYAPPPAGYAPPPGAYYAPPGAYGANGPRVINDYDESQPVPAGYHKSTRMRTGMVIGGAVTFGSVYLLTATIGAIAADAGSDSSVRLLLVPAIGPFTLLGNGYGVTADFFLVIDGLAQAAGIALFATGIALPRTVLVRNDLSQVTITPKPMMLGKNGAGFGVVGSF